MIITRTSKDNSSFNIVIEQIILDNFFGSIIEIIMTIKEVQHERDKSVNRRPFFLRKNRT